MNKAKNPIRQNFSKNAAVKKRSTLGKASPLKAFLQRTISKPKYLTAIVFVAFFAVVGSYYLIKSRAAIPPPPAGGYFATSAPGSTLPSDSECASQVHHSSWEPRVENNVYNHTVPTSVSIGGFSPNDGGVNLKGRALADRVTGNFTGTTDELIQWGACKWGFNDDIVRAVAVTESSWFQGKYNASNQPISGQGFGDYVNDQAYCQAGYTAPCPTSFGLLEIKVPPADSGHPGTYPSAHSSTAFNIDYALMVRRICYEGWYDYLYTSPGATVAGQPAYHAGDEWGCVGFWYSGQWLDQGSLNYSATVKNYFSAKPWLSWADNSLAPDSNGIITVNDAAAGTGINQFEYVGTWYSSNLTGAYGGDNHVAYDNGDYYQLRFNGTKVDLYSFTDSKGGTAAVSIDGGPEMPISLNSPSVIQQNAIYSSPVLNAGNHIIKVRNTSTNATAYTVRVDYAAITPVPTAADISPPTAPTNVIASAASSSQINLSWAASSDNVGVTGYEVYRNNTKLTTVGTTSYADNGLTAGSSYSYFIVAKDAAGNSSIQSPSISATTQTNLPSSAADTTAPIVTIISPATGSTISNNVSIKSTAGDNVSVTKMQVFIDGSLKASSTTGSISYTWNSKKAARGSHTITVKAYDAAGNVGQSSIVVYR